METDDLLQYIHWLITFLDPLLRAVEDPDEAETLLIDLGYAPPSQVTALVPFNVVLDDLYGLLDRLDQAADDDNPSSALPAVLELIVSLGKFFQAVKNLQSGIQANFAGSDFLAQTDILAAIARKLADFLVVRYFEDNHGTAFASLLIVGLVEIDDIEDVGSNPFLVPYRKRVFHWEKLSDLFSDPLGLVRTNFIDSGELLYERLLFFLQMLGTSLGVWAEYDNPDPDALANFHGGADLTGRDDYDQIHILRFPLTRDPAASLAVEVYPVIDPATGQSLGLAAGIRFGSVLEIPLGDRWQLRVKLSANLGDSLGFTLDQAGSFTLINKVFTTSPETLAAAVQFGAQVTLEPTEEGLGDQLLSTGFPPGFRFEVGSAVVALGIENQKDLRLFAEADFSGGMVTLSTSGADGFVASILPGDGIQLPFNLGVGFSNKGGLYFKGSSGLVIRLPVHQSLGPVEIQSLMLSAGFKDGKFPLIAAAGFAAKLGPLSAVVEEMGLEASFRFPPAQDGNLGPVDVALGFKPPSGVGLSVDAAVIKGGGYLYFNPDAGEYAGALELTFADFLSLKAVGIITTRMPDGSPGFSLLVIITAEFGATGIQLGYGFTLLGVGGLLGLNRTMRLEALAEGMRTGALSGIMFPRDVVANAPRIISDLRTFFPAEPNRFLIGPMAKLGWGTPALISLSLGIIIEIPGDIAIIGILRIALPTDEAAILVLQVSFLGAIEFDKSRVWFFATLFESRITYMPLDGEMGVLAAFGADANFVVSVGGFHPRFSPPPLPFPSPRRVALDILNQPGQLVRVEGYFAVTTNTAQFGAHIYIALGFDDFGVKGHLGFDALFQFSPFQFIVEISGKVSLDAFGVGVFSISLDLTLTGPSPYRARGTGSLSLLFFSISADFDITWGEAQDTTLPPIAVMPMLKAQFEQAANWQASLPAGTNLLVSLREMKADDGTLVLHPVGTLEVSQKAVPLDLTIDSVGSQEPSDARHFTLAVTGGGLSRAGDAVESFAMGQFQAMTNDQKLSRPAYEPGHSGLVLGSPGGDAQSGRAVVRFVRYEVTTIDSNYKRFARRFVRDISALFTHFLAGTSAARSPLSKGTRRQVQPFEDKVQVKGQRYTVAFTDTNRPYRAEAAEFTSEAMAREYLKQTVGGDPNLSDALHVIPQYEVNDR